MTKKVILLALETIITGGLFGYLTFLAIKDRYWIAVPFYWIMFLVAWCTFANYIFNGRDSP